MPEGNGRPASLLVFADDWGHHPSSCQHLIRHFLPDRAVYWVNTIGTRTSRIDLGTLRRGGRKIREWLHGSPAESELPANLRVLHPKMWPWFSASPHRWINQKLLARQLRPLLASLPRKVNVVTTIPLVADLMGILPVERWIYYCVDDFNEWPGLDGATLRRMEETLVRKADRLIAVSETLQAKLSQMGRRSELLTHGVDLDFWQAKDSVEIPGVVGMERPIVLFWGLIDRRMDLVFVRHLAETMTQGTLLLAGPEADPDPELLKLPRTVRLGAVPFDQLPALAHEASVLVMPYADLAVTRAMQPLKLKEYLATGKPVVVRDLPATRPWADCLDVADSPSLFTARVLERLVTGLPSPQAMERRRLLEESWSSKALCFSRWALD